MRKEITAIVVVVGLVLTGIIFVVRPVLAFPVSAPLNPVELTTVSLPSGVYNAGYSTTLTSTADPSSGPVWSLISGTLPAGILLSSAGVLSGTATKIGDYATTIQVYDGYTTDSASFTLSVTSPMAYTPGTLLKQTGLAAVYLLGTDMKLYSFSTPTEFLSYGYGWGVIVEIPEREMTMYLLANTIQMRSGTLAKEPDTGAVFLIQNGEARLFPSGEVFLGLGYQWGAIATTVPGETAWYARGADMAVSSPLSHLAGTKVKIDASAAVYLLELDGSTLKKRWIPSESVYLNTGWQWVEVVTISPEEMATYPDGPVMWYRDGTLIKGADQTACYLLDHGLKRPFNSADDFEAMRYSWAAIQTALQYEADSIPLGVYLQPDQAKYDELAARRAAAAAAQWSSEYAAGTVNTAVGSFTYKMVKATITGTTVKTFSGEPSECVTNCQTQALQTYVQYGGGFAGMNGSYFCPPDYAYCGGKVSAYDTPLWDWDRQSWINWSNKDWDHRAAITFVGGTPSSYWAGWWSNNGDGTFNTWHDSIPPSSGITAGIFNYPMLIHNSAIIASADNTDTKQRDQKGRRGAIGYNGTHLMLVVAENATVIDLAYIMQSLGATNSLNLDGGGSSALYAEGGYQVGPGRSLPNAIVLVH
ncbi:hypothetical protein AUK40_06030 [Candidatus Wirthbacteria bacterium CG2_30_54_11]|uniref:Phosphodiester glycosidase domain-containing protein n=1 Tax=Candidatus Wirthbacteria bacterium CG2_30_54_11 TaxID=1817892 RepID=A0A1J5IFB2_9BACT|nr:MAG: hypothetical protein AUK40_06030 [Candidatus Wirthbacteria bacterium CG2_30_54_11]